MQRLPLGQLLSVAEGMQWLGYSYLFVRMQRNPLSYGIDWAEIRDDPQLGQRRRKLIIDAARVLQQSQMIIFNESTEELRSKDVGRIASQYYILKTSIQVFNVMMRPRATEADILKMISMSGEFDNIQYRETESKELSQLQENSVPCQVGAQKDTHACKNKYFVAITYFSCKSGGLHACFRYCLCGAKCDSDLQSAFHDCFK